MLYSTQLARHARPGAIANFLGDVRRQHCHVVLSLSGTDGAPSASGSAQLTLTPVPLPASGVLLALGLVPLALLWLRRKPSGSGLPFAAV